MQLFNPKGEKEKQLKEGEKGPFPSTLISSNLSRPEVWHLCDNSLIAFSNSSNYKKLLVHFNYSWKYL